MGPHGPWTRLRVDQALHLVRRLHQDASDGSTRRQVFVEGVHGLLAASSTVLVVARLPGLRSEQDRPAVYVHGLTEGAECALVKSVALDPSIPPDPAIAQLLKRAARLSPRTSITFSRAQLVRRRKPDRNLFGRVSPRNKVHVLYSASVPRPGEVCYLCVFRFGSDKVKFTAADRQLLDLVHSHCAWIYEGHDDFAAPHSGDLSPRMKETLWKLLSGRGEKQIAAEMGLSRNTVHHYVKAIYRRFEVSSRAELLSRWMSQQDHGAASAPELPRPPSRD